MDEGSLPPVAKIISLVTSWANTSDFDPVVIQRALKKEGVSADVAMGCIKSHLEERVQTLLGSKGNARTTHEQRDSLKLLARVVGTLAAEAADADPVASLLSSLRAHDVAAALLSENRTVELHFFIQFLGVLCSPLQGQLYDCSGTRSDLYDLYTETNLRIAHPTQAALLDLLLILYDETDAPALLSCAAPGNGWATTGAHTARLPLATPRPPPRSAPLLVDMPEPDLPTGSNVHVKRTRAAQSAAAPAGDVAKKHALLRHIIGKLGVLKSSQRAQPVAVV